MVIALHLLSFENKRLGLQHKFHQTYLHVFPQATMPWPSIKHTITAEKNSKSALWIMGCDDLLLEGRVAVVVCGHSHEDS